MSRAKKSYSFVLSRELRWLGRRLRPFLGLHLVRACMILLFSILSVLDPLVLKWVIDDILLWQKPNLLPIAAVLFFLIYTFRVSLEGLASSVDFYAGQRLCFDMRRRLLRHVQQLPYSFHSKESVGDLMFRLEQDVNQAGQASGKLLATLVQSFLSASLTAMVMIFLSPSLFLFVLLLIPCLLVVRRFGYPWLRRLSDTVQKSNAARVAFLQDHLAAITHIKIINAQLRERLRFIRLSRGALNDQVSQQQAEVIFSLTSFLLIVGATASVLLVGGRQVISGALTVGGLVAFLSYLDRIFHPVNSVIDSYSALQRVQASVRRLMCLERRKTDLFDTPSRSSRLNKLPSGGGVEVELQSVTFRYSDGRPLLQNLDLKLEPCERVAIVGASGCGKSTLGRLLVRLFDPHSGQILVDGLDIQRLQARSLRTGVLLMPQEPVLFDLSLEENIRYGNPKATLEQINQAVDAMCLRSVVEQLPDGLAQSVGPRGERLSGGQRQRVALARAYLARPRMLILDEATAALDVETERQVLDSLYGGLSATVLLIAHRLSTIQWADRVLVLNEGRVVPIACKDADMLSRGSAHDSTAGGDREKDDRTAKRRAVA